MADPLLTKRQKRAPIGVRVEYCLCLKCAAGMAAVLSRPHREVEELCEGDDAGKPFICIKCGGELIAPTTQLELA